LQVAQTVFSVVVPTTFLKTKKSTQQSREHPDNFIISFGNGFDFKTFKTSCRYKFTGCEHYEELFFRRRTERRD